jgi:hypothetical protein
LEESQGQERDPPKSDKSRPRCHSLDSRSEHAERRAAEKRRARKPSNPKSNDEDTTKKKILGRSSSKKDASQKMRESNNTSISTSSSTAERADVVKTKFKRYTKEKATQVGVV